MTNLSQSESTDAILSQRQFKEGIVLSPSLGQSKEGIDLNPSLSLSEGTDARPSEEDTKKSDPDPTEKDLADDPCLTLAKKVVVVASDTDLLVAVPNTTPLAMVMILDWMKSRT